MYSVATVHPITDALNNLLNINFNVEKWQKYHHINYSLFYKTNPGKIIGAW